MKSIAVVKAFLEAALRDRLQTMFPSPKFFSMPHLLVTCSLFMLPAQSYALSAMPIFGPSETTPEVRSVSRFVNAENYGAQLSGQYTISGTQIEIPVRESAGIKVCSGTGYGSSILRFYTTWNDTDWTVYGSSYSGCRDIHYHYPAPDSPVVIGKENNVLYFDKTTSRYLLLIYCSGLDACNASAAADTVRGYILFHWNAPTQTLSLYDPSYAPNNDWALPVNSPRVGQDFNCYGCVPTKNGVQLFHTGMDMTPRGDAAIVAPTNGKVHAVYRTKDPANSWCEGGTERIAEIPLETLGFGNTVILSHVTADGQTIYTQYSHLSCLSQDVAIRWLDRGAISEAQHWVERLAFLGNYGNSDNVDLNSAKWAPHLHFEVKSVGTLASGSSYGYSSGSALTAGYFDPINYLYRQALSAPAFTAGIIVSDGAKAYSAPGLEIVDGYDELPNSIPTNALVHVNQKVTMADGDWYQVSLGLPIDVYKRECGANSKGKKIYCHDNIVPDGWVHSRYVAAYNGFVTEAPGPEGSLIPVYDSPAGVQIAQVLGSQRFQRFGQAPGNDKGKIKCSTYWVEIHLGAVQVNTTTNLERGWICAPGP